MRVPLRFHPFLRPLVWGGRGLAEALGKSLPGEDAYGESWEISDHASHQSVVADGPAAGRTLRDLMRHDSAALLGSRRDRFPWLMKFLDAHDWLSVQVHPDDDNVGRLWPGENGKTEAWFILGARPGSRIYAGLKPGVDEHTLRRALASGTVADCLHSFAPAPGDCLFLSAGTVHAVGGGVLMAEIQQSSDATFRLFDWNRVDALGKSRELHVEQALACIDWKAGPVEPVRAEGYPDGQGEVNQALVRCRYFELDYLRQQRPFVVGMGSRMEVAVIVHGQGRFEVEGGSGVLTTGDTLLLPASLEGVTIEPDGALGMLLARLPE